ncbi:aminotransferase gliI [Aspergillus foveolatus]|uniref:aminotransferase gliI n=1 Tax=Aspergillus foveolatus TaxID=210207 RepID=UPI003CCDE032
MDASQAWLSSRVRPHVERILPAVTSALGDRDKSEFIDLATAENYLIRQELIGIYKNVLDRRLTSEAMSYPSGLGGEPYLRQALADLFNQYFEPCVAVDKSHVVAGPGATACLTALLSSLCGTGDAVIVPGSYWSGFDIHFSLKSGVTIMQGRNWQKPGEEFSASGLLACLQQAHAAATLCSKPVRAVVLTNPHNPSGRCYSLSALECAARFCQDNNMHLISDEVYALSSFASAKGGGEGFVSVLALDLSSLGVESARIHMVWSTSKDFGSSGFRMGCLVSQANVEICASVGLMTTTQISSLSSLATAGLLQHPDLSRLMSLNLERLAEAYTHVTSWLTRHGFPYIPATAGVYILARLAPQVTDWEQEAQVQAKIKAAGVMLASGRSFHLCAEQKGWFRIIIAVQPDVLEKALKSLEKALDLH